MRQLLQRKVDSIYFRKVANLTLWAACIFLVYALSLGPALKLSGVKASKGMTTLPIWVRVFYFPLLHSRISPLNNVLDRYVELWIGVR